MRRFQSQSELTDKFFHAELDDRFVFMFGSALTMPVNGSTFGVPTAESMVEIIRSEISRTERNTLDKLLAEPEVNRYQVAMSFLLSSHGPEAVNQLVAKSVINAFHRDDAAIVLRGRPTAGMTLDDVCGAVEDQYLSWELNTAVKSFGELVCCCGNRFGAVVLTTNFDPLIGISIRSAGGHYFRVALAEDGNLDGILGTVPQIVHLHGFYHSTGNLHTVKQLRSKGPNLVASLMKLLSRSTVVVMGYGGWDDVFMRALVQSVRNETCKEIWWCFYSDDPRAITREQNHILRALAPAVEVGKASLFGGIDLHAVIPKISSACIVGEHIRRAMLREWCREVLQLGTAVVGETPLGRTASLDDSFPGWRGRVARAFRISPDYVRTMWETHYVTDLDTKRQFGWLLEILLHESLGPWIHMDLPVPSEADLENARN